MGSHTVAKAAVSVNGTWQKRGHSSKIGVVFAVSVRTGEILNYEVKSLLSKDVKLMKIQTKTQQIILHEKRTTKIIGRLIVKVHLRNGCLGGNRKIPRKIR